MRSINKKAFLGIWRSHKTFFSSGEMKQHAPDFYQELTIEPDDLFTIAFFKRGRRNVILQTNKWDVQFRNKRFFLVANNQPLYEIITMNHFDFVVIDWHTNEKLFFSPLEAWEKLMNAKAETALAARMQIS